MKKIKTDTKKDYIEKERELRAKETIAESEDLQKRFGHYNDDLSVGGMYARKKKSKNPKTKRKSKKKECGCK